MKTATDRETSASAEGFNDELNALKSSFTDLRSDVMDLLRHAFGMGKSSAGVAKDSAGEAVESLKAKLSELKDRGSDGVTAIERKIEENPLPAALIAFGVGYLIARIMTRR